jgi:hypothetical protein
MPTNRGTRHNPKYCGQASYKGHKKWVGTFKTADAYNRAYEEKLAELREEVDGKGRRDVPTVTEFAEATIRDDGRVEMVWPEGQPALKEAGRRASSEQRMREGLRSFIREFAERRLDSFSRDEALTWARGKGTHTRQSVGQFFNHALERQLISANHFKRLGGSKRKRRIDRPDFEILSDEQYEALLHCARASRTDDYGLIMEGAILAVGEAALRPGEIFALHRDEIDYEKGGSRDQVELERYDGQAGMAQGRRAALGAAQPPPPESPAKDACVERDPLPGSARRLHVKLKLVQTLALRTGRRRDARSGVLRAKASRNPVDDRSGGGRRTRIRRRNRGANRRPRRWRLPHLYDLHEAEQEAGTRAHPACTGRV